MSSVCTRLLTALFLAVLVTPSLIAGPREDLLRHVPEDVGFCLMVTDLRDHTALLEQSAFAEAFRKSITGQGLLKSEELKQLTAITRRTEKLLHVNLRSICDDVLGDCVVLAYKPGPPGKPEQEQGLLMLQARKPQVLADLLNTLNKWQKDSGELLRLEEKEYHGVKYVQRIERGKAPSFYCLNGPLFLFSGQEQMLQKALDRGRQEREPALTKRLRQAGTDGALLTLWINPRAFDDEVVAKAAAAAEKDVRALRTFATCWKALDGIALSVRLDSDLTVELAFQGRQADLPPSLRQFLSEANKPSELWQTFPDNALVAVAGRFDAAAILETLGTLLPEAQRDELFGNLNKFFGDPIGRNFVKDLLPRIGPDWGFCVTAPPAADKAWFPQATLAVRVTPGGNGAPAERSLMEALNVYAGLAVFAHNGELAVKRVIIDQREIKYLSGDKVFPPGFQPAFAFHGGFLLLGTAPEAVGRVPLPPAAAAARPVDSTASVPWLRIGVKEMREYITQRRGQLAQHLAAKDKLPIADVNAHLDQLLGVMEFIDRIEVSHRTTPGQVVFTLKVQPAKSLGK